MPSTPKQYPDGDTLVIAIADWERWSARHAADHRLVAAFQTTIRLRCLDRDEAFILIERTPATQTIAEELRCS